MSESNHLFPSDPPAPTGKTLSEIQPSTPINQQTAPGTGSYVHGISANRPGRYYLTEDVVVPAGMTGIRIDFDINRPLVTLDLNGFAIRGDLSARTGTGIHLNSGHRQVVIHNGIIEGFRTGFDSGSANPAYAVTCVLENLTARRCSGTGISCQGGLTVIRNCLADDNGQHGIEASHGSLDFTTASGNGNDGFVLHIGVHARHCIATGNGGSGFRFHEYSSSTSIGNSVSDCLAAGNSGYGISMSNGSVAERCLAANNGVGGFLAVGARLSSNLARRNGPNGNGTAAGILVTNNCVVEDNYCVGNERGIVATGSRNLIQRNACSGNGTNWVIAAGNTANVIVAAKSPASTEAPNGVPLGSSDPLVNYTF